MGIIDHIPDTLAPQPAPPEIPGQGGAKRRLNRRRQRARTAYQE